MIRRARVWLGGAVIAATFLTMCVLAGSVPAVDAEEETKESAPSSEPTDSVEMPSIPRKVIEESPFFFELPAHSDEEPDFNFADVVIEPNLVLYFWSASCPLCLLQMRSMNELAQWAEEHPEGNLNVISVNLDVLGPRALQHSAVHPEIAFPVYYDPGGAHVQKGYNLDESGLPAFYFFLRGGLPVRMVKGFDSQLVKEAKEFFLPRKTRGAS